MEAATGATENKRWTMSLGLLIRVLPSAADSLDGDGCKGYAVGTGMGSVSQNVPCPHLRVVFFLVKKRLSILCLLIYHVILL